MPSLETAWQDVDRSFERFCLTAGIGAIKQMLCDDAQQLTGAPPRAPRIRCGHGLERGPGDTAGGTIAFEVEDLDRLMSDLNGNLIEGRKPPFPVPVSRRGSAPRRCGPPSIFFWLTGKDKGSLAAVPRPPPSIAPLGGTWNVRPAARCGYRAAPGSRSYN
jgi:hypothetical protein